ncbi:MAG: transglutaminase domain-containing protein [Clostridia bacterium]|nr:transglutaminase domain-containing protein [Clostridia bacterium]
MQENWGALSAGLPEDILKAKWAGDFKGAAALIEARLRDERLPEAFKESLKMEKIILERLPRDYPIPRGEAIARVKERIPDFTEEEFDALELAGKLDYIYVMGEKKYFRRFLQTLLKVNTDLAVRASAFSPDASATLDAAIARMKEKGRSAYHARVRHTVYIEDDAFVPGETYTVHIPIPMPAAQMKNIRILTEDAGMTVAPEDQAQRTVCFRETLNENKRFTVEYEFDNDVTYVDLAKPGEGVVYPAAEAVKPGDLEELAPHILFTPCMRALAGELAGGETDPLRVARRFYDFCTTRVTYTFMRSYLTIENGSEYAALNLKGDCGIQALCFITLCRIAGIPARWQSGLEMEPPGHISNHDWAQFYIEGRGWLFCDCSYGGSAWRKGSLDRWNFYFGNLEPWRIVMNNDYQRDFFPPKRHTRIDPYDSQCGEVETETRGLTASECDCEWDVIELTEID